MRLSGKILSLLTAGVIMLAPVAGLYRNVDATEFPDDLIVSEEPEQLPADSAQVGEEAYWRKMSSGYYYNQLQPNEQKFYDRLDEICMDYLLNDKDFTDTSVDYKSFGLEDKKAYIVSLLFYFDNPQYFFVLADFYPSNGAIPVAFYSKFVSGSDRMAAKAEIKAAVDEYVAAANAYSLPEEKEFAVFELMCSKLNKIETGTQIQSIYNAVQDKTYSPGYMSMFAAVMNSCGVECICVTGSHYAWNAINLHGFWYYVDIFNAERSTYTDYSFYNSNITPESIMQNLFGGYIPEVKYDELGTYDSHSARYFSVDGISYFIVGDDAFCGYYVASLNSSSSVPSSVVFNDVEYEVLNTSSIVVDDDITIDADNFPDPYFRKYVSEILDDGDGKLTASEIKSIKYISCTNSKVQSLVGIEHFKYLETLNCYNNKLSRIDVSENVRLKQLQCYGNSFTQVYIGNCVYIANAYMKDDFLFTQTDEYYYYFTIINSEQVSLVVDRDVTVITDKDYDPGLNPDKDPDFDPYEDPYEEPDDPDYDPYSPKDLSSIPESELAFWRSMSSTYYYDQLNENQKIMFNRLDEVCLLYLFSKDKDFDLSVGVKDLQLTDVEAEITLELFFLSNPQYFFLRYYGSYENGTAWLRTYYDFKDYSTRAAARDEIKAVINEYLDATKAYSLPEQKEHVVYELMCNKIVYNEDAPYNQCIYSAVLGETVCAGYMCLFGAVMNACGVECINVCGGDHGWNYIKLHGYWYYVDVTNADQPIGIFYASYNRGDYFINVYTFLKPYVPEVIYDGLDGNEYVERYINDGGITYFIVNDIESTGRLVVPVSGSATSFPASITYNGKEYSVINSSLRGWQKSGDKWYYYNDSGMMTTGWYAYGGSWYYFDKGGAMVTDWYRVSNKWYYFESSGKMVTGWRQVDTKWYFFDSNGAMLTGWKQSGSKWCYLTSDGSMATGWQQINGIWFYFDSDGYMVTGWCQSGNDWYYFNSSGTMVTGWLMSGNKWYYMASSGAMVTGWKQINGKWYYFESSGEMITGWKASGGTWFYFNSNGEMVTGWNEIDGDWYYFESSGSMKTGWYCSGGTWYYFMRSGVMVTGELEINGITYIFNTDGACMNP